MDQQAPEYAARQMMIRSAHRAVFIMFSIGLVFVVLHYVT